MADNTKQQVREFYDQIGWSQVGDGLYQNARYEDLRPVSREYVHKCHMRVKRYLAPNGDILLDAGSGPVQWPEYLTYSEDYQYRLCADISITALKEARTRLGDKGLFVVADIANLPFKPEVFDGVVSMHAIHHLPVEEHKKAYSELYRVMKNERSGVVVNGWDSPKLMQAMSILVRPLRVAKSLLTRGKLPGFIKKKKARSVALNTGTHIKKTDADWLRSELADVAPMEIHVWRSLSTRVLRILVHRWLGGYYFLKLVYWLEDQYPKFFGENGQYPLVVISKPKDG
ncbi:MAG TPA: class I SAM-dependent methyltransferase [Anaerolineales bacterium]|nr:class I SAM-dependent methyltransferase [Anaerolineales bacterium]